MATNQAPAVPRRYALGPDRPNGRTAWIAAWIAMADGRERPRAEIIATMRKASPISFRTARDLLIQAVDEGHLQVVSRDRYGRPTLKRPT
jgi:hypothetical protein